MGSDPDLINFVKNNLVRQHPDLFDALQPLEYMKVKLLYPRGVGVDTHTAQTTVREETAKSEMFTLYAIHRTNEYLIVEFDWMSE